MTTMSPSALPTRRQSLRRTLVVALSAILLGVLATAGAGVLIFIARNEQDSWRERQTEAARAAAYTVTAFLQQQQQVMVVLGELDPAQVRGSPKVASELLRHNPALIELIRVDRRGDVVVNVARDTALLSNQFTMMSAAWFQQAPDGTTYFDNIQVAADNAPYLVMSTAAANGDVVASRLGMDLLWETVRAVQFGETGRAYVLNRDGQIIAHGDPQVVLSSTIVPDHPALSAMPADGSAWGGAYTNFQGHAVIGVATTIPGTNWLVVTELSVAEASVVSRSAAFLVGGGLLLFGLLASGATILLLNAQVFQPLQRVQTVAQTVGSGELHSRVMISRNDEIGQVAQAFNIMLDAISNREQALQDLASSLEQQVGQRTSELRQQSEEQARLQNRIIEIQASALAELATPLIPITDDVVVMPLIGVLDPQRGRQLLRMLLQGIEAHRARTAILDITGVPIVDTQVAQMLLDAAQSVRLIGARVVLTGIRPEVAQTLVGLGVDLHGLQTFSTLQHGIANALVRNRPVERMASDDKMTK